MATETQVLEPKLPSCLKQFLVDNDLPLDLYDVTKDIPRYFRLIRSSSKEVDATALSKNFSCEVKPVWWLPGELFYQVPSTVNLVHNPLYEQQHIIGMDAASGFAIAALEPSPGESVCEICCAPGAKTTTIADRMQYKGTLVGVDISQPRLSTCAKLLKRYRVAAAGEIQANWWCKLYLGDGTTFDVAPSMSFPKEQEPASAPAVEDGARKRQRVESKGAAASLGPRLFLDSMVENALPEHQKGKLKRTDPETARKAALKRKAKGLPVHQQVECKEEAGENQYDKVIVDAECTHDGSIRHILKYNEWGWDKFADQVLPVERMKQLPALQRGLISNGFRLLKAGGVMVYSTCSLTKAQNEDVVQWLLENHPNAQIEPIPLVSQVEDIMKATPAFEKPWIPTGIPHTIRFHPMHSQTSGLFIARIRKTK